MLNSITYNTTHLIIQGFVVILVLLIIVRLMFVAQEAFSNVQRVGFAQSIGIMEVQSDFHAITRRSGGAMVVLADGIGRNYAGAISSTMLVETVLDEFEVGNAFKNPNYFFQKSLNLANRRILDQLDDGISGASVSIALLERKKLYYATVGNVQIAVFRRNELIPVTEGHTVDVLAEKKYRQGSITKETTIALLKERRLYNFVGQEEFQDIEIFDTPLNLRRGDIVVFMTDGVHDIVSYTELENILKKGRDCQRKANAIIEAVKQADKRGDNASAIVIAI